MAKLVVRMALLVCFALAVPTGASAATDSDRDQLTNAFENTYGLSPTRKDSNKDGLRDAAEDPDGDGLSNLGEQRFGTSPLDADGDNDGIRDAFEDSNHNGTRNGLEQDKRPVPSNLTPSLSTARKDQPVYYGDGCHSSVSSSSLHPCVYGDRQGSRTIALFGDSHAGHWFDALEKAARSRGWRIVVLTKSACPSADVAYRTSIHGAASSCRTWRTRAVKWIGRHKPDVVLMSNAKIYVLLDGQGDQIPSGQRENAWRAGVSRTLAALPAATQGLVLADTPLMGSDVPTCLADHPNNISACVVSRASAFTPAHDAAEKAAADANGATFASLGNKICSYDPCPLVINELLLWRGISHMTSTFSRQLAPAMAEVVTKALNAP